MVLICSTCNAENPQGSTFCEDCGIELSEEGASPSLASELEPLPDSVQDQDEDTQSGPANSPDSGFEGFEEETIGALRDESQECTENLTSEATPGVNSALEVQDAILVLIAFGSPTDTEIPLQSSPVVVGKFDPSQGPIDIDLGSMPGSEYLSRRHAELFLEEKWMVRDLGSTNGVFIRKKGQENFLPRLQSPMELEDGDEVAFGNLRLLFKQTNE